MTRRQHFSRRSALALAFPIAFLLAFAVAASPAAAQPAGVVPTERLEVWDLKVGTPVAEMPPWIEFKSYACGSDGGPPLRALAGFQEYKLCRPDAEGLYEVYFEYDDEMEYRARALEDIRLGRYAGTNDKSYPLIVSALFNEAGILTVIRVATDPRPDFRGDNFFSGLQPREVHHNYATYLSAQFHMDAGRDCHNIPLAEGETQVGDQSVKLDCERVDAENGIRYTLQARYFRKPGQYARDPRTGQLTTGQFESTTRGEVRLIPR